MDQCEKPHRINDSRIRTLFRPSDDGYTAFQAVVLLKS